jgi:hypothetical protein
VTQEGLTLKLHVSTSGISRAENTAPRSSSKNGSSWYCGAIAKHLHPPRPAVREQDGKIADEGSGDPGPRHTSKADHCPRVTDGLDDASEFGNPEVWPRCAFIAKFKPPNLNSTDEQA